MDEVSASYSTNPLPHLKTSNVSFISDDRLTKPSLISVFKDDFPAYKTYQPAQSAKPPPLGDIMHKDEKYFCTDTSETAASFEYRPMAKPVLKDIQNKLRMTNFKMEREPRKINVFKTTHDHYYPPKQPSQDEKVRGPAASFKSPIFQEEKLGVPVTLHREMFPGHDPKQHPTLKAPAIHHGGPPTIQGDKRLAHFDTTHADQFQQKWMSPVPAFPAPTGSNIPSGDRDKIGFGETTMRSSYTQSGNRNDVSFDLSDVRNRQRKTNFKQHDGHGIWDDYKSMTAISFVPKSDKTSATWIKPRQHRNHSSHPEGDTDPARIKDQLDTTMYRYHMGSPARGVHNTIVSGANLRTKSNVWFGKPSANRELYDTTTHHTYLPKSVPYSYNRLNFKKKSDIPLDYCKDEAFATTMAMDYKNHKATRTTLNLDALDRIRESHAFPSVKDSMELMTTNQEVFTPKTSEKLKYDRDRMQQSSVPLGTFAPSKPLCIN